MNRLSGSQPVAGSVYYLSQGEITTSKLEFTDRECAVLASRCEQITVAYGSFSRVEWSASNKLEESSQRETSSKPENLVSKRGSAH